MKNQKKLTFSKKTITELEKKEMIKLNGGGQIGTRPTVSHDTVTLFALEGSYNPYENAGYEKYMFEPL